VNEQLRIKIHHEYFNTILFRDLIERHDIKHPKTIIDLAQFLINNIASRHSIRSLHRYLKSLHHSISPETIAQYLDWFDDTYFLFSLYLYDGSLRRSKLNDKKYTV
jgi:predicted AAA+ superfamily ATPase